MKTITPQIRRATPAAADASPARALGRPAAAASVDVQIDALVFHGFSRAEGQRAGSALQRELERLVAAEPNVLTGPGSADTLNPENPAGTADSAFSIRAAPRPELTGRRAARAIFGGLRG
jgi:hypothetical protein